MSEQNYSPKVQERPVNPPKEVTGLPQEFLLRTFRDPKFISNIKALAHHAHLNLAEGAFVVRSVGDMLDITDVEKARRVRSIDDLDQSFRTAGGLYEDPEDTDLLAEEPVLRQGIVIALHSHPIGRGEAPRDFLRPSSGDLESWEELRIKLNNPYFIVGIVVKDGVKVSILLFQADPNRKQDNYYQQWDESEGVGKLFQYLAESGIRFQTVELNLKAEGFKEKELEKVKNFAIE